MIKLPLARALSERVRGLLGLTRHILPHEFAGATMTDSDPYDPDVAAQFAAYMVLRAGGRLPKITLSKFLYIGEKECIRQTEQPLFNDRHYSLRQGPICSKANDGLNGTRDKAIFSFFLHRDGEDIVLNDGLERRDFDCLTEAFLQMADALWDRLGHMSPDEIVDYTHTEAFPEWQNTDGRAEIADADLAKSVGIDPQDYAESKREFESLNRLVRKGRPRGARYAR